MDDTTISVYDLTTKLCEKIASRINYQVSDKTVKRLRSRAFEIFLSKRVPVKKADVLDNYSDPHCHLVAWLFILKHNYNLHNHAQELQAVVDALERSSVFDEDITRNVLYLLLQLKQVPHCKSLVNNLPTLEQPWFHFRRFTEDSFKLEPSLICTGGKFSDTSFHLKSRISVLRNRRPKCVKSQDDLACKTNSHSEDLRTKTDDRYDSPTRDYEEDIWDVAMKSKITDRRTWETLGDSFPETERPFAFECGQSVGSMILDLQRFTLATYLNVNYKTSMVKRAVPHAKFVREIKFLLVGMCSESFIYEKDKKLNLRPGTYVLGITPSTLKTYCRDLLFCGRCYKALSEMSNPYRRDVEFEQRGFIFREFCDGVGRYLSYYRVAVLSFSENDHLLKIQKHIGTLKRHLAVLASICKVGPFAEKSETLPNGVALLNYLYQKLTSLLTGDDVALVLNSIFYPCMQVYFSRFLQRWIFEGIINDPYNEFFVCSTHKYLITRGRTYWTRSFKSQEDIIPDFLHDLSADILSCGKAMNLLKLCNPSSPLCMYLMGKKPSLLSRCVTLEQLKLLERDTNRYYLEVVAECESIFSFSNALVRSHEQRMVFMNLITQKRSATLRRLELEKLRKLEKEVERKQKAVEDLKLQYDEALQHKKLHMIEEIKNEIKENEECLKMENLRNNLIKDEAKKLIEYYDALDKIVTERKHKVDQHLKKLKKIDLDGGNIFDAVKCVSQKFNEEHVTEDELKVENVDLDCNITSLSSPCDSNKNECEKDEESDTNCSEDPIPTVGIRAESSLNSTDSRKYLDIVNANVSSRSSPNDFKNAHHDENTVQSKDDGSNNVTFTSSVVENFEQARRNKMKVMSEEMGLNIVNVKPIIKNLNVVNSNLSDLQKNRLKVMSSEFGLEIKLEIVPKNITSVANINKLKVMNSNECFYPERSARTLPDVCDNENYINSNIVVDKIDNRVIDREENLNNFKMGLDDDVTVEDNEPVSRKTSKLSLDLIWFNVGKPVSEYNSSIFNKFMKSPNFEFEKPIPMSIDSSPCTEVQWATPNMIASTESLQSQMTTTTTNFTDEGSVFTEIEAKARTHLPLLLGSDTFSKKVVVSKRVSIADASEASRNCPKFLIERSIMTPLSAQFKLVNSQLLKYFVNELQYLVHVNSLEDYFFLMDGEFGRNITEGLFEKLCSTNFPIDLINCRSLQKLVQDAMNSSIKLQENPSCLSFKVNNLPRKFDLMDPDVLDCLSLTYKVNWPLNILLPVDMIAKYDEIFRFLLKIHRMSWVLKKVFMTLKMLVKLCGKKEALLIVSPQFQKVHHYRHVMTHFIQTLQNYVVGEVIHTCRVFFERQLESVTDLDQLYTLHTTYIKNILFMCLLNQKSAPIRKTVHNIFILILKFYHYLNSKEWEFDDDTFVHPHFKKLDDIFANFLEFVFYLFRTGGKAVRAGYQPHLVKLLDMLNINNYYMKEIGSVKCTDSSVNWSFA